jgi:hypothetical protein
MKIDSAKRVRADRSRGLARVFALALIGVHLASCTHLPTGEKAFKSFDECVGANMALAGLGGIGAGVLTAAITRQVTGSKSTARAAGVAVGIASAVGIGMTAWKKCAAVYSTSEAVAPAGGAPARRPATAGLSMDALSVAVEGDENAPPVPAFEFSYAAPDPALKDIKAKFRHKVEIVRFKAQEDESIVVVDASDQPITEGGKPILLQDAHKQRRDRLAWVAIAEDGRDDYVEDVVIQQGARQRFRHKLLMPNREQLPLPLPVPMRYGVTVEVGTQKVTRNVDFTLLQGSARPRTFAASGGAAVAAASTELPPTASATAPSAPASPPASEGRTATPIAAPVSREASATASTSATSSGFVANAKLKRRVSIFDDYGATRKPVAQLNANTPLSILEKLTPAGARPIPWVKVTTATGQTGWVQAAEVAEGR